MDQRLLRSTVFHRPAQCMRDRLGVQAFMDVIAHDLSRKSIRHKAQIGHTFLRWQIGDVRDPYLFWAVWNNLIGTGLEQIRMAPEAMMAVGRLVVSPLASYQ